MTGALPRPKPKLRQALGIPLWDVYGQRHGWQIRPDCPRQMKNGTIFKYELPKGDRLILDVHPSVQPRLGDPHEPLWITEGVRKGDALASHGLCTIALVGGVWGFRGTNHHGGKVILPDWEHMALNDREVIVAFDSDLATKPGVHAALKALWAFLRSKRARPARVEWPEAFQQTKWGVDDFFAQGHSLDELQAMIPSMGPLPQTPPAAQRNGSAAGLRRLTIKVDTALSRWTDEGQAGLLALTTLNGAPILYQRARHLVVIAHGVKPPRWMHRPPDVPVILEASEGGLYELAGMAATWQQWNKRDEEWVTILPPRLFVSTLLGRPSWPFSPLEGLIHSPTLRPDGTLLQTPGYDVDTGLYLDGNGTLYPPLPDQPDIFDAQAALNTLTDVLRDFPWAHPYDRSAAIAAILSLVCRYTVLGNVPLFGISATTRGSGKGLLADVIALIGTGRRASLWSQAEDDAEERKRLLALGMDGDPIVTIDNVTRPLGSAPLDLALTSSTFKDRILGTQTTKEVPMHTIFFATGNNLQYVGDLARRVVPIALDPQMEKPEERTGFTYPDLLAHVAQKRPQLVIAALTILKAYFGDGCPAQGLSAYGSFQPWSDLIRSALVWVGEADPCEGRKTLEAHDLEYGPLAGLLEAWHACYPPGTTVTLKRLKQDITVYRDTSTPPAPNAWDDLEQAVLDFDRGSALARGIDTRTFGNALKRVRGRVIDQKRLVERGTYRQAVQWTIEILT